MNRRRLTVVILAAVGSVNLLLACGDKFLVSSRGTRYQRAPVGGGHAAILIYTNPASDLSKALSGMAVDATLRKAGYQPTSVDTSAAFETALTHGHWDLVLVGLADAQAVSQRVQSNSGVLPVVLNASAAVVKQTRKLYPVVLRLPSKNPEFLDAVDEALASRPKSKVKTAKATS